MTFAQRFFYQTSSTKVHEACNSILEWEGSSRRWIFLPLRIRVGSNPSLTFEGHYRPIQIRKIHINFLRDAHQVLWCAIQGMHVMRPRPRFLFTAASKCLTIFHVYFILLGPGCVFEVSWFVNILFWRLRIFRFREPLPNWGIEAKKLQKLLSVWDIYTCMLVGRLFNPLQIQSTYDVYAVDSYR